MGNGVALIAVSLGRISTCRRGVGWTELVEAMRTSPTSQLLLFLPVFVTAPLFGFVLGFLVAAAG